VARSRWRARPAGERVRRNPHGQRREGGDRVALTIGNHWAFPSRCSRLELGATVAPLDTLLKEEERADILAISRPLLIDETASPGSGSEGECARPAEWGARGATWRPMRH